MQLNDIDRKLLRRIQTDARKPVAELSEEVGLTASPCARRLRILEEKGIVKAYVTLLDQNAVGFPVSVFVSVRLQRQNQKSLDAFEAAVRSAPEVMECYLMAGGNDFLLRVVCPDLVSYNRFLKEHLTRIPGVASIQSSFALQQVIYRTSLPI